jgi:SAM-dependent methyltransferase
MGNLADKLAAIYKIGDFSYLFCQVQDGAAVTDYYRTNRLSYLFFHDRRGFMHMGLSSDGIYRSSDLLAQADIIKQHINRLGAGKVLELGSGLGANLSYLAEQFPATQFFGIDICQQPLRRYCKNKNTSFLAGDFNRLSDYCLVGFNLAYAIETICHSRNLSAFFSEIYRALSPGSALIVFDGYYLKDKWLLPDHMQAACTLTEKGMAVDCFHSLDVFKSEAAAAGLKLTDEICLSRDILPTLHRFERLAGYYFRYPALTKAVRHFLPEKFVRNALAGYLMPELIEAGVAGYYLHVFSKI